MRSQEEKNFKTCCKARGGTRDSTRSGARGSARGGACACCPAEKPRQAIRRNCGVVRLCVLLYISFRVNVYNISVGEWIGSFLSVEITEALPFTLLGKRLPINA